MLLRDVLRCAVDNLFWIKLSSFLFMNTAIGGTIFFQTYFFGGRISLTIDGKEIYSGLQTADRIRNGEILEWPVIWITNVPVGGYPFRIQFQDLTSVDVPTLPGVGSGSFEFNFAACSAASIALKRNSPEDFVLFGSFAFPSIDRRGLLDKEIQVLVGPLENRLFCHSTDTPESKLKELNEILKSTSDIMPTAIRLIKLEWSQLKKKVAKLIRFTNSMRNELLKKIRALIGPNIKIAYSQDSKLRLGPKSFDCSGLVSTYYREIGLNLPSMNVKTIVESSSFREISQEEVKPGDLVVHLRSDDKLIRSNHVGVYTGIDAKNNPLEISATTRQRFAELDFDHPNFKSSIVEHKASNIGPTWRFYRWADSE